MLFIFWKKSRGAIFVLRVRAVELRANRLGQGHGAWRYSHPPLIKVNWFLEKFSITDWPVNEANYNICSVFIVGHTTALILFRKLQNVTKKQWTLTRLRSPTDRIVVCELSQCARIVDSRLIKERQIFGYLDKLWEFWCIELSTIGMSISKEMTVNRIPVEEPTFLTGDFHPIHQSSQANARLIY